MPVRTGRIAELRRALDRVDPSAQQTFDPREHLASSLPLPRELADELRKLDTEDLLELLHGEDVRLAANRDVQRFVSDLVRLRTGGADELADDQELAQSDAGQQEGPGEEREFFVGWMEGQGGTIELVSHAYQPSNRAQVSHTALQRYRSKERAGGIVGKVDNKSDLTEALRLQQQNDRWTGHKLDSLGQVKAKELVAALKAVISPKLKDVLLQEGNDIVTLCVENHRAVLLTKDGHIYQLSRLETRHLALVGILPRHWFLPLMWWKQMMAEEDEKEAERGRGKKRIYKGRYDDEDEVEEGEEKEKD